MIVLRWLGFVSQEDLRKQEERIMSKLNGLITEVAEIRGTVQSAIALIHSLAARIEACECDPEKLGELVAELNAQQEALAAAVAAHSEPVEPDEPVEPLEPVTPEDVPVDDEE